MKVVSEIEQMILSACVDHDQDLPIPESVENTYQKDFQMQSLKVQLRLLPDLIKRHGELTGHKICKVTNIRTVCEVMNSNPVAKRMCSELHLLLRLYLTIPVTTASAERTFSAMKRLKTYLRSSMTQERLNHVLILNSMKARIGNIDLVQIAKSFISVNERRHNYFGKF